MKNNRDEGECKKMKNDMNNECNKRRGKWESLIKKDMWSNASKKKNEHLKSLQNDLIGFDLRFI